MFFLYFLTKQMTKLVNISLEKTPEVFSQVYKSKPSYQWEKQPFFHFPWLSSSIFSVIIIILCTFDLIFKLIDSWHKWGIQVLISLQKCKVEHTENNFLKCLNKKVCYSTKIKEYMHMYVSFV